MNARYGQSEIIILLTNIYTRVKKAESAMDGLELEGAGGDGNSLGFSVIHFNNYGLLIF
jgi:hypothetical protein